MAITWFSIMGYISTTLSILTYIPQTIKTTKQKHGGTLSKITFSMLFFGCAFWAVYSGLLKNDGQSYLDVLPGFITNVTILFLMIPILWYVINDSKLFATFVAIGLSVLSLSFIFMFSSIIESVPEFTKYLFVIIAGSLTGFPFIPQTIRVVKDRKIGDVSLITIVLLTVANLFWVLYWGGMIQSQPSEGTIYLSTFFSFAALVSNLPTLYIYVNNQKKLRA